MFAMIQEATSTFMPHGMCYLWEEDLLWTHVVSDVLIGAAYYAIPPALILLVVRARREVPEGANLERRGLPLEWLWVAFGLFIVACGTTHFFAAWNVWHADYWVSGGVKVVTAIASVGTAVALPPLLPRALKLVRDARESEVRRQRLEEANRELAELNDRLREMDEMKTQLFANVSHELRTPISLILGPVSLRLDHGTEDPELEQDLKLVKRNARLLQKRVDDLLELARLDAGVVVLEESAADVAGVVRTTVERYSGVAHSRGVELDLELPKELAARIDGPKIERVVENLVTNAFKWVPDGGTVGVSLESRGEPITPDDGQSGELLLVVEDSGPGIPEEQRPVIFDRFRQLDGSATRAVGGAGLGLSIVADFVRLHDGEIRVEESALGGARFVVTLPWREPMDGPGDDQSPVDGADDPSESEPAEVAPPMPHRARTADRVPDAGARTRPSDDGAATPETAGSTDAGGYTSGTAAVAASRPRIMVVEDSADMRDFVCSVLETRYECDPIADARSALEYLENRTPDAVITDVMMPGMDGRELLDRLRSRPELEHVPVLVLTALAEDENRVRMLRSGADDYVTKPFEPAELEARISNLVTMKRVRELLESELEAAGEDLGDMTQELARRRWELEEALQEVRIARDEAEAANQAKTDFLAVMSHELRTPLNAILGYTDLLETEMDGDLATEQKNKLDRIKVSAKHLVRLIDDILDFARTESDAPSPDADTVKVLGVVDEVVGSVAPGIESMDVDIQVGIDPDLTITSDFERLRRILTNLVTNAVKFTEEGSVHIDAESDGEAIRIAVRDTGPGISEEDMAKIFEPFWQVDQSATRAVGGSGLGLSIARRLAHSLGGDLVVESEEGVGSTFTLRLPVGEKRR